MPQLGHHTTAVSGTHRHGRQGPNSALMTSCQRYCTPVSWASPPCGPNNPPGTNTPPAAVSCFTGLHLGKPEGQSLSCVSSQQKHRGKTRVMCLFANTLAILEEDIHLLVFSCSRSGGGGLTVGGQSQTGTPCGEEKSQMIFLTSRGLRHPRVRCDIR